MKALFIHSDYLEYEAKKKTKVAEDIPDTAKTGHMDDALVAFIATEKMDEGKETAAAEKAVENIIQIAGDVNTRNVVIYPYAHLSPSLSNPKTGTEIFRAIELRLKEMEYNVLRAPFGWYKSFKVSCKEDDNTFLFTEFSRNL